MRSKKGTSLLNYNEKNISDYVLVLQPPRLCCVECAIHQKQDVREE